MPKGYTKYGPNVTEESRFAPKTKIVINEEGKALKKAWKWKLRGERDYIIMRMLEQYGVHYKLKQLHRLWQKPFYAGIIVHGMLDEPVKGDWEPLVSPKDFLIINKRLEANKRQKTGYEKQTYNDPRPLSGSLICGNCKSPLYGYEKRKKKANGEINRMHYYKCYACGNVHISANTSKYSNSKVKGLHDQFKDLLSQYKIDKKYNAPISTALVKLIETKDKELEVDVPTIKKRITVLKDKFRAIKKRWAMGAIDEETYQDFKKEYTDDILNLEQSLPKKEIMTANP